MPTDSRNIKGQASSRSTGRLERIASGGSIHFYKNNHIATEISAQGVRHVLWAQDVPVAQHSQWASVKMLKSDRASSIIGTHTESMAYSPYGYLDSHKAAMLLAFNGQWFDHATKGYVLGNGYRALSTALYRFHQPDSLSPFDIGGLNSYIYCLGDPVNYHDPSGHVPHFIRSLAKGIANRLHLRTPSARRTQSSPQLAAQNNTTPDPQPQISERPEIQPTQEDISRSLVIPSYNEIFNGQLPDYETAIARMPNRSASVSSIESQSSLESIELTLGEIRERIRETARLTLLQPSDRRRMAIRRQSI